MGSTTDFRYIFDQSIGDNATAPSITGPGITVPLRYAASGRNAYVNCAVYVYAAMSADGITGTVGISHKVSGGASMTAIAGAASGAVAITGTTFRWWPHATGTPMIFALTADVAFDRVVLCTKADGGRVKIGAFTIIPLHSQTIT